MHESERTFRLIGTAAVIAPLQRETWLAAPKADIFVRQHGRYARFMREAQERSPLRTAIVHPCSQESLRAAIEARDEGLIDPGLVGPIRNVRTAADAAHLDLSGISIEGVEHSHAAATRAVELGVSGEVAALMRGSLHADEFLQAVVAKGPA